MSFAASHLNPGEELVLDFKPHWKSLMAPALWTVATGVALGAGLWIVPESWRSKLHLGVVLSCAAVIFWLVVALPSILAWISAEYVLTDERLVARSGVIRRRTYDIPLAQVNSVTISQGVVDRIARVGDVSVESASEAGDVKLTNVPRPTELQNMISRLKEQQRSPAEPTVSRRLDELEDMHARGLVSEAEYSAKRAELLDRL